MLALLGILLCVIGAVCCLVGWVLILKVAFAESFLTGIGCFFIPVIMLIYAIFRFRETKQGLGVYAAGLGLLVVGMALGGFGGEGS